MKLDRTLAVALIALLVLFGVSLFGMYRWATNRAETAAAERIRATGLELMNERARAQRTVEAFRDSMRVVFQREAEQRQIVIEERNAYAREAQLQRITANRYELQLAALRDSGTAVVHVDSQDVRRSEYRAEDAAFAVEASVALPAPPDPALWWLSVTPKPFQVGSYINCGPPEPPHGLRPVVSQIELPPHVRAEIIESVIDPDAGCNPLPHRISTWQKVKIGVPWAAVGAGVTLLTLTVLSVL